MCLTLMPNPRVDSPEISDLIVDFDACTLERREVLKSPVIERFRALGRPAAVRIVERIPERAGFLEPDAVDGILLRSHREMQRLTEEFEHGSRVRDLLRVLIGVFRDSGVPGPYRVVDLGCGLGFVLRWIATHGGLGEDAELIGADYNAVLIHEAQRLSMLEALPVRFVVANAFELAQPATVIVSTGVMHHFRDDGLTAFFRAHERAGTLAFAHFDFQPSPLVPFGSWLFHVSRFREPLARHDGILSALRAHDATTLLEASRTGSPRFEVAVYNAQLGVLPVKRVFHTLLGVRPEYRAAFIRSLGPKARRVPAWS